MYKNFFKRFFDFVFSLLLLIMVFPLFIVISLLLLFIIRENPFFFQKRPGKNEKIFSVVKFKSMTNAKDNNGELLPDAKRLTKVGSLLRKTSLDEIPQLLNVVKGDMSFIGPRPLLVQYLKVYTDKEKLRHTVRPGITGLAQVSGRNLLNWDDRLKKDVEYVENISFIVDIKIIFSTIKNVLTSKDVVVDPQSIMPNLIEYRKKN